MNTTMMIWAAARAGLLPDWPIEGTLHDLLVLAAIMLPLFGGMFALGFAIAFNPRWRMPRPK